MFYNNSYLGMHFIWWVVWALVITWIVFWPFARLDRSGKVDQIVQKRKGSIDSFKNKIPGTAGGNAVTERPRCRQIILASKKGTRVFVPFSQKHKNFGPVFYETTNN